MSADPTPKTASLAVALHVVRLSLSRVEAARMLAYQSAAALDAEVGELEQLAKALDVLRSESNEWHEGDQDDYAERVEGLLLGWYNARIERASTAPAA